MIAPETINIASLPFLPLANRRDLPNSAACYLVIEGEKIIYVGQAKSLLLRWQGHHRLKDFKKRKDVKIAWLIISDESLLREIETALIQWFQPELNAKQLVYGTRKKPYQFLLTETASSMLDKLSKQVGITRSECLERIIRREFFGEAKVS